MLNTETRILTSEIVGDDYKLFIAFPPNYDRTTFDYPLVVLLDANIIFGMTTEIIRLLQFGDEIADILIVGIGYPDEDQHLGLRSRDLTPTPDDLYTQHWLHKASQRRATPIKFRGSGGASCFLAFIHQELMPYLHSRYRINPAETTLIGDSYGGLFGLYTLFQRPELFKRYIIGSPSIWWDDQVILAYEEKYAAAHTDLPARIFLSVGALEIYESEPAAMVSNMKLLAQRLLSRGYKRLDLTSRVFEDETHLSVIPATISTGLRVVFNS